MSEKVSSPLQPVRAPEGEPYGDDALHRIRYPSFEGEGAAPASKGVQRNRRGRLVHQ